MRRALLSFARGALIAGAAIFAACGGGSNVGRRGDTSDAKLPATDNARRSGYAGSAACAGCHAELMRTFVQSPMHRMTRPLGAAHPDTEVHAPFAGEEATFHFHDDVATASSALGERFLTLEERGHGASGGAHRYRLTKIIGGRVREDFVGVEVDASGAAVTKDERILPVSWMLSERRWRYKGYSVMTRERAHLGSGAIWRSTCIACHNTATLLDAQASGLVTSRVSSQETGEGVGTTRVAGTTQRNREHLASPAPWPDRLLPTTAQRELVVLDADRLAEWKREATRTVASFAEADLVELGIGCEACHAGGRMHVENPRSRPSFEPIGAPYKWTDPTIANGGDAHAVAINRACSRCHQVLFSGYSPTWEGGTRLHGAGGSTTNSGEGRDFLLGACAQKMDCTNCHDPHGGTAEATLELLATPAGNAHCTSCHGKYASDAAVKAHAHHDPRGAGGACIACHMPKKNMGLDGKLTRYHRIGSPTDSPRVLFDRPLECATCHPRATVRSLVGTMETWFRRTYDRGALEALYGDLDQPVLMSTLERGKAHEKAVAMELLGGAKDARAMPLLLRELNDPSVEPYPIVRDYARAAILAIDPAAKLPARDGPIAAGAREGAEPDED